MVFLVMTIVGIAALMLAAWSIEPCLRISWRRGLGWTVSVEGVPCGANTTV